MEDGFHIAVFTGHLYAFIHVSFYVRISFKITVYQLFGFFAVYTHTFCQTEHRNAVDDTEISGFCLTALLSGHIIYIYFINFGSSCRMDIITGKESIDHILVFTQVRHDAKFYL